ncbi:MAG TPA: hypothetical protein VMF89_37165, partial [Polyangiales bacterium]|nr:hypothetical protein [Polyangiales bacterium]
MDPLSCCVCSDSSHAQAQQSDAGTPPPTAAAPEAPPEQPSVEQPPVEQPPAAEPPAVAPEPAPVEAPATVIAPPESSEPEPEPEPGSSYSARARADRTGASETPRYGTGSRQGVPLEEQAASVSVIESETLRVRGVNNLDEALTLTPGVTPTWQYGGFLHIRV